MPRSYALAAVALISTADGRMLAPRIQVGPRRGNDRPRDPRR